MESIKFSKANIICNKTGNINVDYTFTNEILGNCSAGKIKKAIHNLTGQVRAIKVIKKNPKTINIFLREIYILKKLSHPNIMEIYEVYDDNRYLYIISELCNGGELFDMIHEKGHLTELEAKNIMKQLLSAISYCHKFNIIHSDLKPENIMLDYCCKTKNKKLFKVKIIDWGDAKFNDSKHKINKLTGTSFYLAPEVIKLDYNEKCDIWSLGIILFNMIFGYMPFDGNSDEEIFDNIEKGELVIPKEDYSLSSDKVILLIKQMLTYDANKRPSAEDCLKFDWFTEDKNEERKQSLVEIKKDALENMANIKKGQRLQQATSSFIVNQLMSSEEKEELYNLFSSLDKNGDGVLDYNEIYDCYKLAYGDIKSKEEVDKIIEAIDLNEDGLIDYDEFLSAAINKKKIFNEQNLEKAFNAFDKNGNKRISITELKDIFKTNKKNEFLIADLIEKGENQISYEDFKKMMISSSNS